MDETQASVLIISLCFVSHVFPCWNFFQASLPNLKSIVSILLENLNNLDDQVGGFEQFTYCSSLIYFSVATVTITIKPKLPPLLLPLLPLLSYYFATKYFAADIKSFRCGRIDNSTVNT